MAQLEEWVTSQNCKLVTINGIAGVDKPAQALALADRMQSKRYSLLVSNLARTCLILSIADPAMVLEGIVALERRSLLKQWVSDGEPSFTLQFQYK